MITIDHINAEIGKHTTWSESIRDAVRKEAWAKVQEEAKAAPYNHGHHGNEETIARNYVNDAFHFVTHSDKYWITNEGVVLA